MRVPMLTYMADMIECMRVRPLLQPLLDGELDDARGRLVLAHVEACERCGLSARAITELKDALAQRRAPAPEAVDRLERFVGRLATEGPQDAPPAPEADPEHDGPADEATDRGRDETDEP